MSRLSAHAALGRCDMAKLATARPGPIKQDHLANQDSVRVGTHRPPMTKETNMHMTLSLTPLVSLIAGILILIAPSLLNYIVAFYLILIGVIGLFG